MKTLAHLIAVASALVLTAAVAWAGPDELAVERTVTAHARAITDLPRTRDVNTILRFYAKDYIGITDGEVEGLQDVEKNFSEITEQIELGAPVGISYKVTQVKPRVSRGFAWVIYDVTAKIGAAGEVLFQLDGKCTAIMQKQGATWLMQHEHCSTPRKEEPEDKDSGS